MKDKSKKSTYSTTFGVDPKSTYSTTFGVDPDFGVSHLCAGIGVDQPLRVTSVRPYSLKPFAKDPPAIETLVTLAFYLEMINSSVFRDVLNITPVGIVMNQTMRPA